MPPGSSDPFALAMRALRTKRTVRNARLKEILVLLRNNAFEAAEGELTRFLAKRPNDADALYLKAQTFLRLDRAPEALPFFARCLEAAPDYHAARYDYAAQLLKQQKPAEAIAQTDILLSGDCGNPLFLQLKAGALEAAGAESEAHPIHARLVESAPDHAPSWVGYGNALRNAGLVAESIAAYRKAIALDPSCGLAYWGLANLKTVRFAESDIAAMEAELKRADIDAEDRIALQFALGKALEDAGAYGRSWEHYAKANASRRVQVDHDPAQMMDRVAANRALFTRAFFDSRRGWGSDAPDPIFILGRPRSGSTLIEQILASHSAIEGTAELRYLPAIASRLGRDGDYPQILATLDAAQAKRLGEEYLEKARPHRKLSRPLFVDKNPANYWHIGMIQLILPNAKIIDARRNPAAVCLSMFKQNYSTTNLRLAELATVYRAYVALMAHFDCVLPDRVHRVIYEDMVGNPEAEVRRLLDYAGLPFEERCLRFYETKRAVLTPSSEQVRRPISSDAVDHWKHYEPWLGTLIRSLGDVLTEYPNVPDALRAGD